MRLFLKTLVYLLLLASFYPLAHSSNLSLPCAILAPDIGESYFQWADENDLDFRSHIFKRFLFEMTVCPREWLHSVAGLGSKEEDVFRQDVMRYSSQKLKVSTSFRSCAGNAIRNNNKIRVLLEEHSLLEGLAADSVGKSPRDCLSVPQELMPDLLGDWAKRDGMGTFYLSDEILLMVTISPSALLQLAKHSGVFNDFLNDLPDRTFTDMAGHSDRLEKLRIHLYAIFAKQNTVASRRLAARLRQIRVRHID